MLSQRWRRVGWLALAACLAIFAVDRAVVLAASRIGVAAAIRNDVEGVQGAAARKLNAGSQVFQEELVRTGVKSVAQLLFLDETSLSIGPQAEVRLDRFVFDPNRGGGDVVISATRGAFRFITGSQDPRNYTIRTPIATIGVRGTILDCYVGETFLICILQEGGAILRTASSTYSLTKLGQAILIRTNGEVERFTPDGTFRAVAGVFPFPLFGDDFRAVIHHFLDDDSDATILVDELFALGAEPPDGGDDDNGDDDNGGDDGPPPPPPPDDDGPPPPPPDDDDDNNGRDDDNNGGDDGPPPPDDGPGDDDDDGGGCKHRLC